MISRFFDKDNQRDFQDVHKNDVKPQHRMFWGLNRPNWSIILEQGIHWGFAQGPRDYLKF